MTRNNLNLNYSLVFLVRLRQNEKKEVVLLLLGNRNAVSVKGAQA
jgi:hypothetical protein